ncbi:hypothetical protein GH983_22310 (plasmid) [Agrobacterium sp. MA01]|uniref:hypothetical protein n=1 Tax=Agrobacterium sp. MA01 TaxID=2664893 RepID=UPI00129B4A75|nr:hypothetical protein [Agrobacterium sp. MA01]QGG93286.1 hypothetical protein GH983_22310 [Agrobacterium sp. MA01]
MENAPNSATSHQATHDLVGRLVHAGGSLLIISTIAVLGNWIATGVQPAEALPGILVLCALSLVGISIAHVAPIKLPVVAWVSILAVAASTPVVPGSSVILSLVDKVSFLALATPVLAYAGLALSQEEFRLARRAGWKLLIVAICVMLGTFMGSVIVADVALRLFA